MLKLLVILYSLDTQDAFAYFTVKTKAYNQSINESINQRNFYSAPYKMWMAALDNVNI